MIQFIINKKIHSPFYQADVEKEEEIFYNEDYISVWDEAKEMGLIVTIPDRVELLKELKSVFHIKADGVDYFYNHNFDAYWEELAHLLEGRL